jgi:competence protein ComGC
MKQKAMRDISAFTRIELLVVIFVILIVVSMSIPISRARQNPQRIACLNNLKEIGAAYRLWAADGGDRPQAETPVKNGGWADFLTNADQGAICWTNYVIMSDELGQSNKLLICPSDERLPAIDFKTDFKDNSHLSYFVGVGASDLYPQSIQGGDRNLGPGARPDSEYGYSPKSGKGNDVAVPISGTVSWSLKMHSAGNPVGAGNILLGDGSGQETSSYYFNRIWLRNAQGTDNWPAGHVPASPSIRLVFP